MSKLPTDRRDVANPRKSFGKASGPVERLGALGWLCTAFSRSFFGVTFRVFLEGAVAEVAVAGTVVQNSLAPLSTATAYGLLASTALWLLPFGALIEASVVGLRLGRDEIRCDGIQVPGLSSREAYEQFERALIERTAWEENPNRRIPTSLYSSEPPRYG